jgi:hypothetical protein
MFWRDGLLAQVNPAQGPPLPMAIPSQTSGSIRGTITDSDGAVIPGVRVTLIQANSDESSPANRVVMANSRGAFEFSGLAAGTYRLKIEGAGIEPVDSGGISIGEGERRELPITTNRLAKKMTTVNVVATSEQIGQAQVQEQEQQRILGILPNYYTSYIWDAAPMTPKLKYKLAFHSVTDPMTFIVAAGVAGAEQWHNTFPGYAQESEGYAKRFGATYADTVASRMISFAVLPSLFHQDPRYFYRGSGSVRSRILYALESAVICRGDNGQSELNYSKMIGSFAAAGLSNLYRAPQDRQAGITFRNGLVIIGSGAAVNLLREFVSRKLTPHVPAFAKGKP